MGKAKKTKTDLAIHHDDSLITNCTSIANLFNSYFTQVGIELSDKIPQQNKQPLSYFNMDESPRNSFRFFDTNPDEVGTLISKLPNKSAPLDKIPTFIFKKMSHVISPIICELFNLSIREGIFPSCLKTGRVIPIFKAGKKNQMKNYRPITTLPVLAKLFEKLAHKRMMNFISKFKLLNRNQFGFIASHNTADALLEFLDNAYDAINSNEVLLAIFLDFSKAFDTVDHQILLKKLEFYGFRGTSLQWIRSFLMNRKQFVEINSERSTSCDVNIGVPQGSTLGPLLFLLYINDFKNSLTHLKSIHFADDTTLYKQINLSVDHSNLINAELTNIQEWINVNKLSLNVQKSNYMIISNRARTNNLNLKLGGENIGRVTDHKFLGVTIDETLKFDVHINKLCAKVSQSIGILRRISYLVPHSVLRNVYYALVYSRFTYAISAWGSAYPTSLRRLKSLVKKAILMVTNHMIQEHIPNAVNRVFLQYDDVYRIFVLAKTYNIIREGRHEYFSEKFTRLLIPHRYVTRSQLERRFTTPFYVKTKCQNSFLFRSIRLWNRIPNAIKSSCNIRRFKNKLKIYYQDRAWDPN